MDQIQKIDLSVASPVNAANLALTSSQGTDYRTEHGTWEIAAAGGSFTFTLNLPSAIGVNLVFVLCSTIDKGTVNCPVNISVNGNNVASMYDPKNLGFYNMGWFLTQNIMRAGNNQIVIQLDPSATTKVFVRDIFVSMYDMQHQSQTNWCWSAVSTSTSIYYNATSPWTQCTLVNQALGQTTCCSSGSSAACNQPWYLDRALSITGNFVSWQAGVISLDALHGINNVCQSLGARIGWRGGGGHFVMLTGVLGQSISVQDPWYGNSFITYASFCTGYQGSGSWTHTYFTKS